MDKQNSGRWNSRIMELAQLVSEWSKDISTKCGAVIVDDNYRIISTGFNGFPRKCDDSIELYKDRRKKLHRVLHSEVNAILFAKKDVEGCTIFVYPFPPCAACMAVIIQSGIKKVMTCNPSDELYERWGESLYEAFRMAEEAGVEIEYM